MARRVQLRPSLNVGLQQKLAMTPSLLQKIELLQLSRLELSEMLQTELTENPVLEEGREENPEAAQEAEKEEKAEENPLDNDDFDYEYFFGEYLNSTPARKEYEADNDRPSFELFLAGESSLIDHLNWQLNLTQISEQEKEIAEYIIGNINPDGFLMVDLAEVAEVLEVSQEDVEEALEIVQEMDPTGVGARDLSECLLLQLRAAGMEDSLAARLVGEHLELVQSKKHEEIAEEIGCCLDEVEEALKTLRRFDPRPGQKYSSQKPQYIQPDVYISRVNGEYQINMNDDGMPRLSLNRAYRKMLKDSKTNKETKSFIKEKVRAALELIKSVDQREQTIFRVCRAIVARQEGFLDRGKMALKPMLIKDVAEELGVHSSTISRVVANKYAHTPQGVIELRNFFTVGLESADGENVSIIQVKERIKNIIEDENPKKPMSDQQITKVLNNEGVQITRRTVAKYRDQMDIPGSRARKRAAAKA
ncbi:MAG TPA: RNA polymerase factor sigma-54 [Acidobacteriota bacterium]|nr:RNA polymerase factor sigma-54 [Acidobacteriota bacterium]